MAAFVDTNILLDAVALMRRARPDIEVVVAGGPVVGKEAYAADLGRRAADLGVELTCTGENGSWAVGDEGRLLQATSNLIENALRLTPAGGSVQVLARPGQISVRDTGPGLASEDLPRAFDRFYLYDRYRSERAVGSGLGLAIVKELTTAMGGGVTASSVVGRGAEFTISVPTGVDGVGPAH